FFASPEAFAREPASKIWGAIHGLSLAASAVAMLLGFAAGIMYLGQIRHLKHKQPLDQGLRLPSLEWLQHINQRATIIALMLLGIGVLSGMILNSLIHRPGEHRLAWHNPLVLSTLLAFVWLSAAVVITQVFKPLGRGRRLIYVNILNFLLFLIALAVGVKLDTQHGGGQRDAGGITKVESRK
ncbi:MAG: hypothetical protein ACWGMZ_10410, partial [Thermoguttaceae bacterium]